MKMLGEDRFGESGALREVSAHDFLAEAQVYGRRAVVTRGTRRWLGLG
jgi:hypothetical protein